MINIFILRMTKYQVINYFN